MSRRLIGTLTDPSGTPLAGWLLTLDARRNAAPSVPIGASESVVLDVSGGYDLVITDGLYMALLTAPGNTIQRRIGLFLVAPGADIDVLTLISLYSSATYPGPNPLAIEYNGVQIVTAAERINFTGAGVVASALGSAATVAIDAGGVAQQYVHTQSSAAATWIVNHNLGHRPLIDVLDVGGNVVGAEVVHVTNNQANVLFSAAYSGQAVCI